MQLAAPERCPHLLSIASDQIRQFFLYIHVLQSKGSDCAEIAIGPCRIERKKKKTLVVVCRYLAACGILFDRSSAAVYGVLSLYMKLKRSTAIH